MILGSLVVVLAGLIVERRLSAKPTLPQAAEQLVSAISTGDERSAARLVFAFEKEKMKMDDDQVAHVIRSYVLERLKGTSISEVAPPEVLNHGNTALATLAVTVPDGRRPIGHIALQLSDEGPRVRLLTLLSLAYNVDYFEKHKDLLSLDDTRLVALRDGLKQDYLGMEQLGLKGICAEDETKPVPPFLSSIARLNGILAAIDSKITMRDQPAPHS